MGLETILLVFGLVIVIAVGAGAIKAKRRAANEDTNATPPGETKPRPSPDRETTATQPSNRTR